MRISALVSRLLEIKEKQGDLHLFVDRDGIVSSLDDDTVDCAIITTTWVDESQKEEATMIL